jgi:hypothetical protein
VIDRQLGNGGKESFRPALYYALVDGGWYVSPRVECVKSVIDRAAARKGGKGPRGKAVPVNSSLYLAPRAAKKAGGFVGLYLERQTHEQALAGAPVWYALHRCGVVSAKGSEKARQDAVFRLLGFVPVSGDGAPYSYEARTDEVVNRRHGSLRRPRLHGGPAEGSPPARLLRDLRTLRVDLRFREDGVHTMLTGERAGK